MASLIANKALVWFMVLTPLSTIFFSYIVAVSFIGVLGITFHIRKVVKTKI